MTAQSFALFILVNRDRDKLAEAFFELRTRYNETVYWQPALYAAILCCDMGDNTVCK